MGQCGVKKTVSVKRTDGNDSSGVLRQIKRKSTINAIDIKDVHIDNENVVDEPQQDGS